MSDIEIDYSDFEDNEDVQPQEVEKKPKGKLSEAKLRVNKPKAPKKPKAVVEEKPKRVKKTKVAPTLESEVQEETKPQLEEKKEETVFKPDYSSSFFNFRQDNNDSEVMNYLKQITEKLDKTQKKLKKVRTAQKAKASDSLPPVVQYTIPQQEHYSHSNASASDFARMLIGQTRR